MLNFFPSVSSLMIIGGFTVAAAALELIFIGNEWAGCLIDFIGLTGKVAKMSEGTALL